MKDTSIATRSERSRSVGPYRPESVDDLKKAILATKKRPPKKIEAVLFFALAWPDLAAFCTVHTLAAQAGVSPASVVRTAAYLGFAAISK